MEAYLLDWLNLLLRWLHLIAGAAWIGASFYFVMLDNSLRPPMTDADARRGVFGEFWAVHGGGFYHSRKFLTGPAGEPLPDDLHWSKWEAYTTWLSGMGLLAVTYWFGASTYLIDQGVMRLAPANAVGISVLAIAGGWLAYDGLCRALEGRERTLAAAVIVLVLIADWTLFQLFSARAAYVHVGVMLGTMMVGNVFIHIIPGQRKMVASIRSGLPVDPSPGVIGKQRSVHNTYMTLPVLFIMISNHYPMTYADNRGWLVLAVIMLAGMSIRQFFVLRLRGRTQPLFAVLAACLLAGTAVYLAPRPTARINNTQATLAVVHEIVARRCEPCHSPRPSRPEFSQPPKGIVLQTGEQIVMHARKIAETTGNRYMPLGNLTKMTEEERGIVATWAATEVAR